MKVPGTLLTDEYQLCFNAAKLCIEKINLCSVSQDSIGCMTAAKRAVGYYDRCLQLIEDELKDKNPWEEEGGSVCLISPKE